MASYSTWQLLENWVLKTQFISLYITKQQHQQKWNQSQKEKKKKKTKTKKKPRKNQTPQRTSSRVSLAAWVARASGHATQAARAPGRASLVARPRPREIWDSREPGRATQVARPRPCDPGRMTWAAWRRPHDLGRARSFSLSLIWSPSLWSDLTLSLSLIWFDPVRWGCAWDLKFFKFFWFINRVLETRFLNGHYVEKDATSDVIKP